eukprot:941628-Pyramimonas_sp.AAC.1
MARQPSGHLGTARETQKQWKYPSRPNMSRATRGSSKSGGRAKSGPDVVGSPSGVGGRAVVLCQIAAATKSVSKWERGHLLDGNVLALVGATVRAARTPRVRKSRRC